MGLLELAERCEAATEETYSIFEQAFSLCFPDNYMPGRSGTGPFRWSDFKAKLDARAWESAALTLVPEGCRYSLKGEFSDGPGTPLEYWSDVSPGYGKQRERGYGKTPALAICAAALRAQEATNEKR